MNISFKTAAKAVGGYTDSDASFTGVFTDSRNPLENGLFIALKGTNFDGHKFLPDLCGKGIAGAIVNESCKTCLPAIYVEDTHAALLALGAYYRSQFDIPVVGLTGSVGKTSTKDMIYCVLSSRFRTLKTKGNMNNNIGMPMTLFNLDADTEAAVIEMGMNHKGEISRLVKALRPTIGVITNVGVAHIENLGSREGILAAKMEILDGLEKGSPLIINADNDMLRTVENSDYRIIRFGIADRCADVTASDISADEQSVSFRVNSFGEEAEVYLPVPGHHNVYNALSAIAAGHVLGIPLSDAVNALGNYSPEGMRQRIVVKDGITRIIDCYNSNPDSCKAAIDVLAGMKTGRRIAVLGDMFELGSFSVLSHADIGYYAASRNIDVLFTYGEESVHMADAAKKSGLADVRSFRDCENLSKAILEELREGDSILFKASRGMKLENVIERVFGEV